MSSSLSTPEVLLQIASGSNAGQTIRVAGPAFAIGRDPECQLRPMSPEVSRRHAEIDIEGDAVILRDLGSRNGTLLNDEPISEPKPLEDGDRIKVGPLQFVATIKTPMPVASDEADDVFGMFENEPMAEASGVSNPVQDREEVEPSNEEENDDLFDNGAHAPDSPHEMSPEAEAAIEEMIASFRVNQHE